MFLNSDKESLSIVKHNHPLDTNNFGIRPLITQDIRTYRIWNRLLGHYVCTWNGNIKNYEQNYSKFSSMIITLILQKCLL